MHYDLLLYAILACAGECIAMNLKMDPELEQEKREAEQTVGGYTADPTRFFKLKNRVLRRLEQKQPQENRSNQERNDTPEDFYKK